MRRRRRALDRELRQQVRPLLDRFCAKCHSSEEPEADIDLQRFTSLAEARRGVVDLAEGRRDARQGRDAAAGGPAAEARGSPGPPRLGRPLPRLRGARRAPATRAGSCCGGSATSSTPAPIRDLTGVALDPAREFPQDGAAGEGFTNTGDALVMSPALLGKYLDAAKDVAAHAVPLPDGFRFSRAATRRDWTDEIVADIRRLYDRFADKDGKLPLEAYLAATIELRGRSAAGRSRRPTSAPWPRAAA